MYFRLALWQISISPIVPRRKSLFHESPEETIPEKGTMCENNSPRQRYCHILVSYHLPIVMKKTFYMDTEAYFGQPIEPIPEGALPSTTRFSDGDVRYYRGAGQYCVEQSFKGWYGYLQCYDLSVEEDLRISIETTLKDIHVFYLMRSRGPMEILDGDGHQVVTLDTHRAAYIYLPASRYTLLLQPGKYSIFGFYFKSSIFRDGSDLQFPFLQPVLQAHRQDATQACATIDFYAGPFTAIYIRMLAHHLKKGDLDSEVFIISHLKEMIKLSQRKVNSENPDSVIHYPQQAKQLVQYGVELQGMQYALRSITDTLPISFVHLNDLFRKEYGMTINGFKKMQVIEKAKRLLQQGHAVMRVSDLCGFTQERSFYRLFKSYTGLTPKGYLQQYLEDTLDSTAFPQDCPSDS